MKHIRLWRRRRRSTSTRRFPIVYFCLLCEFSNRNRERRRNVRLGQQRHRLSENCRPTSTVYIRVSSIYDRITTEDETTLLTTSEAPINLGLIIPGAFYITPLFKILYQHDILPENSLKHEGHFILILLMSGDRLLSFD
jgi:hypothetical protein